MQKGGTLTIRGTGNTITNTGTIEARDGSAIQGLLSAAPATGTVLINRGVIGNTNQTASASSSAINVGGGAQVTNSGEILMSGGGQR